MVEAISAVVVEKAKTLAVSVSKEALAGSLKEGAEAVIKESPVQSVMETIKNSSLETLKAQIVENQKLIKETSPYSDEINKYIKNIEELKIYRQADLKEIIINNKHCLIREIDSQIVDDWGKNNFERITNGPSSLDKNGMPIELHHIGET